MTPSDDRIASLRRFNRFYTKRIGVLREGPPDGRYTLPETRLLWELAHRDNATASELAREIDLDPGYLSRLLRGLKDRKLVKAKRSSADARQLLLWLSDAGQKAFAPLDQRSQDEMGALLARLADDEQRRLLAAMASIERLLDEKPSKPAAFVLRAHCAGDIGWITARHGALYADEYGWNIEFEALVGHIACRFIEQFDPLRERCWIAERDGMNVGCVMLVQARDETTGAVVPEIAQLRLLLVEPAARGLGLGETLVRECERFARQAGYLRIRLWTNSVLLAARGIYRKTGYRLVASEAHASFGKDLVGETWELAL